MANEVLQRDENHVTVLGGVTDDSNQFVTMLRVDPITKRLLISATGMVSGTVTNVATGTGLTGGPITTTGTISLDSKLAPLDTLGTALQSIRVNAGATYDGTNIRCYINGSLVSTSGTLINYLTNANALSFVVGASDVLNGYLDGQLDEMGIWSRTLSGTEITTLYNSGAGIQYPFSTSNSMFSFF